MSRHEIRGREPHLKIVLGWDAPLSTFFAQVWDERKGAEGSLLLWEGCRPGALSDCGQLAVMLDPFVTLSPDLREELDRERNENPGWIQPDRKKQRAGRRWSVFRPPYKATRKRNS